MAVLMGGKNPFLLRELFRNFCQLSISEMLIASYKAKHLKATLYIQLRRKHVLHSIQTHKQNK